jgi:hypothetical protein
MVKKALILGSANTLRSDLRRALDLSEFDCVIACKLAGLSWSGRLDAWVSLHPERFERELAVRRGRRWPMPDRTYGHRAAPGVTHVFEHRWPGQKISGSSGHYALRIAIEEYGCDRCVLCGIPMDKSLGRIDGKDHWSGAKSFLEGWRESLPFYKDKTRSMSGWTKQLLGEPTLEWLSEANR